MMEINEGFWIFSIVAIVGMVAVATLYALGGLAEIGAPLTGHAIASSCSDSDGGKNIFEKGTVKVPDATHSKKRALYTDKCVGTFKVIEYTCSGGAYKKEVLSCAQGCFSGACVR